MMARTSFLALTLTLLGSILTDVPAADAQSICGDVNGDDQVTATDALAVLAEAVGTGPGLTCDTGECAALEARVAALETLVAAQQLKTRCISTFSTDQLLLVDGCNLQVVNGSETTEGATGVTCTTNADCATVNGEICNLHGACTSVNGFGNVIIGYNEEATDDPVDVRSGSHNLVIGRWHSYSSYGGIVAGEDNQISSPGAAVCGGSRNDAMGELSSISGGWYGIASGLRASISGGLENTASGETSSVSGGRDNIASGSRSSVSGGRERTASGTFNWAAGSLTESD
jgi:hypothetical protein